MVAIVIAAGIFDFPGEFLVNAMLPTIMILLAIVASFVVSFVILWLCSLLDSRSGDDVPRLPRSALGDSSNPLWDREMDG